MKKTGKIGLFLLLGAAVFTFFTLRSNESSVSSKSMIFFSVEGRQWVEKCIEQHPEILWLASANVRKTEEGKQTFQGSYSEQLFGQKYVEFDRTFMTIRCLKLILDGSGPAYLAFTAEQPKDAKLYYESFHTLHLQGQRLLKSKWEKMNELQMAEAMEAALVLGDMGKSEKARELFKPYGISAPDHDDFYGEAMKILEKHPELCPSFAQLLPSAKKLLVETANLAHYGHITHLEGNAGMFRELKNSRASSDPIALSFDLFIHTCDVAGALGHVNNQSSLVYTETTHRALQALGDAVRILADPQKTEWDAYNAYLKVRSSWMGLSSENRSDRVLTRIGAMLRLFTPEEGEILRKSWLELDANTRNRIFAQFDVGPQNLSGRTPTYMPALLVNLSNDPGLNSKEERLSQAVAMGLPFIARVLEKHKELLANGEISPNISLNFNHMAGVAKTSLQLLSKEFFIDQEGNVRLASE